MSTLIDLTGQRFGKLVVIKRGRTQKQKVYWLCQCDCGNLKEIPGDSLRNGVTKTCGCRQRYIDLTGQKFERLTVQYKLPLDKTKKGRGAYWHCVCDCGKEIDVLGANLRKGATKSCGCYSKEKISERSRKDIAGKRFGLLIALEPTKERNNNSVVWKCQCDCGNFTTASVNRLEKYEKLSCGCLKESFGVRQIKNLLDETNIPYTVEQKFKDCIFPETNSQLRFDFYIDNKYLLEYDGAQHYYASEGYSSWNTKEHLQKVQDRDKFKNNWCKEKNIPLIRIPYTKKIIKLEDILLESSTYIMK